MEWTQNTLIQVILKLNIRMYKEIGRLGGGGSDYAAFVQHKGVPSVVCLSAEVRKTSLLSNYHWFVESRRICCVYFHWRKRKKKTAKAAH